MNESVQSGYVLHSMGSAEYYGGHSVGHSKSMWGHSVEGVGRVQGSLSVRHGMSVGSLNG